MVRLLSQSLFRRFQKTKICSSTIIQDVNSHCNSQKGHAAGYFYFDFNDACKQDYRKCIRSLLVQLSTQSEDPIPLNELLSSHQQGSQQPSFGSLQMALQRVLKSFDTTYLVFDALDECNIREGLLEMLHFITSWNIETLHILCTSRKEKDITESLEPLVTDQICIQSALVDADIRVHIHNRLQSDRKLSVWPEAVRTEIETTLVDGAHGM